MYSNCCHSQGSVDIKCYVCIRRGSPENMLGIFTTINTLLVDKIYNNHEKWRFAKERLRRNIYSSSCNFINTGNFDFRRIFFLRINSFLLQSHKFYFSCSLSLSENGVVLSQGITSSATVWWARLDACGSLWKRLRHSAFSEYIKCPAENRFRHCTAHGRTAHLSAAVGDNAAEILPCTWRRGSGLSCTGRVLAGSVQWDFVLWLTA